VGLIVALRSLSASVATMGSATVAMLAARQPAVDKRVLQILGINAQTLARSRTARDRMPIESASPGAV